MLWSVLSIRLRCCLPASKRLPRYNMERLCTNRFALFPSLCASLPFDRGQRLNSDAKAPKRLCAGTLMSEQGLQLPTKAMA